MPQIWREHGIVIFIWSNEGNEPLHFHITRGKQGRHCPKFWVYHDGRIVPDKDNKYSTSYNRNDIAKIIELQYCQEFLYKLHFEWRLRFGMNSISYIDLQ